MNSTHKAIVIPRLGSGTAIFSTCLAFLVAVSVIPRSSSADPTLEETLNFLKSYVPAHSDWDWVSAIPYAYPIEVGKARQICDNPQRRENECLTRFEFGEDWRRCDPPRYVTTSKERKCLTEIWFNLNDMVTEVRVLYSHAVTLTCASGRCITQRERDSVGDEVSHQYMAKYQIWIYPDDIAERISNAFSHAIELGGGSKPAF